MSPLSRRQADGVAAPTRSPRVAGKPPARPSDPRNPLFALQTSAGNRATSGMLRGRPATDVAHADARPAIQRFGSEEHRSLGDRATSSATYDVGSKAPGVAGFPGSLVLGHGDLVALSGDYFDPRDTIRKDGVETPNPDALFRLSAMPSADVGQTVGTRDEVLFALYRIDPKDPRFGPGGIWEALRANAVAKAAKPEDKAKILSGEKPPFSEAVVTAVMNRYHNLAAQNREHFVSPTGLQGSGADAAGSSALGTYRALHEDALRRAFEAGQNGGAIDVALAREAAAQHFLTDSFAAGHVRTPRSAIQEYWTGVYPLFWDNLRKKIAHSVAVYMNDAQTNIGTVAGTVAMIYESVYASVLEKTKGMPAVGFGDLVSLVAHDLDNEMGLQVINDLGETWLDFGDSKLDRPAPDNRTREMAEGAVSAGVADIQFAHRLGQSAPGFMDDGSIFGAVRGRPDGLSGGAGKFAPEKFTPRPDPSAPVIQTWQAASMDVLWGLPVRSDLPEKTYGVLMTLAVTEGEIHETFEGMAKQFPSAEPVWDAPVVGGVAGHMDAQTGFREGFLKPLMVNPQLMLRSIIDFDPSQGQAFFNTDDAAREDLAGKSDDYLRGMTLNSRADRIKAIIEGTTNFVDDKDGDLVIRLFAMTPLAERPLLYRMVEGHAWTGDWIEGVLVADDELWNSLSPERLAKLRAIINGK